MSSSTTASSTPMSTAPMMHYGYGGGAMAYIDNMLMFQSMSMIQSVFEKRNFTITNLLLIAFLLSFDAIRKALAKCASQIDFVAVAKWLSNLFASININFRKVKEDRQEYTLTPYVTLKFTPTTSFWEGALMNRDENGAEIKYTKTHSKTLTQKNVYEYKMKETYANVSIISDKFQAHFKQSLDITSVVINGHSRLESIDTSCCKSLVLSDNKDATSFSDLLPFPVFVREFKSIVHSMQGKDMTSLQNALPKNTNVDEIKRFFRTKTVRATYKSQYTGSDMVAYFAHDDTYSDFYSSHIVEFYIAMIPSLLKRYPKWDLVHGFYEFIYINTMCDPYFQELKKNKKPFWTRKAANLFGCDVSNALDKVSDLKGSIMRLVKYGDELRADILNKKLPDYDNVTTFLCAQLFPETCQLDDKVADDESKHQQDVILYGDIDAWLAYVQDASSNTSHKSTTSQENQVYILKVVEEVVKETKHNPEYDDWEAAIEKMKSVQQPQPGGQQPQVNLPSPPPKNIVTEKVVSKIGVDHINSVKRDICNLYLRKDDKQKLLNCLLQYKENKERLKELGIPNKLGIMLYGEPGTGKSSTIQAIATFLQKNIYYIQMNEVKTNQQLHGLFNYVTKKCADGGIIVMEDIDAMTHVVHKRASGYSSDSDSIDIPNTHDSCKSLNMSSSDALTLEFFLNILQGSLTADDTVFITTTNHLEKLDPAFYRDGRFDIKIEMKAADHHQISEIFRRFFDRNLSHDVLQRVPEFTYTPATLISQFRLFLLDHHNVPDATILEPFLIDVVEGCT